MKIFAKINTNMSFGGNFYEKDIEEGVTYTEGIYDKNLLKPIWNGTEWVESITPEEIAEQELEKQKILKQQQYEELLPTDWYVIRFIERGIEIPEEIKIQRQAILDKYST